MSRSLLSTYAFCCFYALERDLIEWIFFAVTLAATGSREKSKRGDPQEPRNVLPHHRHRTFVMVTHKSFHYLFKLNAIVD